MREWNKPACTFLLSVSLCLFFICLYLSHLPLNYTYDGMVFASHIERDHQPLWDYFHPHHLIYTFLGRLIFLWGKSNGANWDGLVTLQFFDILTGIVGILTAFHLLVRETNDRFISALSAAGLAFTFSYWYFSTSPGVRIFATVTPLIAWYILTYLKNSPPAFGWVVGFAHAFAVLGHQTNLLLLPAFLGGIWCLEKKSAWEKFRASAYYLTALMVGVLSVYGFIGRYICYRKTYESWLWWVFSYFHVQAWGGHLQQAGFDRGKFAMVQAFLGNNLPSKTMMDPLTFGTTKTIFQYVLLLLLGILIIRLKNYWAHHRQVLWVSIFWLLAFVPFFIWWEPWNIEFWVSSTAPCWVLMSLITSDISNFWKNPILRLANRGLILFVWGGLVTLLFFNNFQGTITKQVINAYGHKDLLGALDWKVRSDDLLVLDGINTIPFYIDRYQKRQYLSLHAFLKKYNEKETVSKKSPSIGKKSEPTPMGIAKPDPWADLSAVFQDVWKHHRKVWVLTEAVDPKDDWRQRLEKILKLPDGKLVEYFNQYQLDPVTYHEKVYFYEILQPVSLSDHHSLFPKDLNLLDKKSGAKTK